MPRIVVGRPASLQVAFNDGETVVDPGAVTVEVLRDDGAVLLAAGTPATGTGAGPRAVEIAAPAEVDWLHITWTSATHGTVAALVEVVGGRYVDLPLLAATPGVDGTGHAATVHTPEAREAAATAVEDLVDSYCGAFTQRYHRETLYVWRKTLDGWGEWLLTSRLPLRRVLAANAGGVAHDHDGWVLAPSGVISGLRLAHGTAVDVAYAYGRSVLPADLQRACQALARQLLLDGAAYMTDRARGIRDELGVTFLSTPGDRRPTGLPFVDATLNRYAEHVPVIG